MVVDVRDVSVKYKLGDFRDIGLKEYIFRKFTKSYSAKEFWAIDGVDFTLEKGDFLGIVGTNGAGKSTLLKVISGVLSPETGEVRTKGQISALLELGTGFDSELTIKENIYLRGALLGYSEEFMNEKYSEIMEFSELSEFEGLKLRQLSSGMKSRLAFSIASMLDPDILILDEVLAVGDAAFRKKSEKKMLEIIKNGTTTLFVSHSLMQIKRLSNKVLWLNRGKQMAFGDTKTVCAKYEEFIKSKSKAAGDKKTTVTKPEIKKDDKKPEEKKAAEKKPEEKKSVEKKPTEIKPADKKPAEKKPADKKPANKKPSEKKTEDKKTDAVSEKTDNDKNYSERQK